MSSMSGSYLAGAEGEHGGDDGGDGDGEENRDAAMESRGPSQQDGVRNPGVEEKCAMNMLSSHLTVSLCFTQEFSQEPKEQNYSVAVEEQDSEVTVKH